MFKNFWQQQIPTESNSQSDCFHRRHEYPKLSIPNVLGYTTNKFQNIKLKCQISRLFRNSTGYRPIHQRTPTFLFVTEIVVKIRTKNNAKMCVCVCECMWNKLKTPKRETSRKASRTQTEEALAETVELPTSCAADEKPVCPTQKLFPALRSFKIESMRRGGGGRLSHFLLRFQVSFSNSRCSCHRLNFSLFPSNWPPGFPGNERNDKDGLWFLLTPAWKWKNRKWKRSAGMRFHGWPFAFYVADIMADMRDDRLH